MIAKASLRHIRISPRKFRLIIPLIKGARAEDALMILASVKKKAAQYATDLLRSALANAKRVQGVDPSQLYVTKMVAGCGPMIKRYRAASMGRAVMVRKRACHVAVELDEIKGDKAEKTDNAGAPLRPKEMKELKRKTQGPKQAAKGSKVHSHAERSAVRHGRDSHRKGHRKG
jgi:large subunit ribosomal protein L22